MNSPVGGPRHRSAPPNLSLSAGKTSDCSRLELPNCEWTRRMVALTCDLHAVASSVAARFSAVFVSICHSAKAWYVRAHFRLLVRHYNSVLSNRAHSFRSERGDS